MSFNKNLTKTNTKQSYVRFGSGWPCPKSSRGTPFKIEFCTNDKYTSKNTCIAVDLSYKH